jgi:hypothetical protein
MNTSFVSSVLAILLLGGALAGIVLTDSLITMESSVVEAEQESDGSDTIGRDASLAPSEISVPSPILCHYEGKTYSEGAQLGHEEDPLECHIRDGVGIWERNKEVDPS